MMKVIIHIKSGLYFVSVLLNCLGLYLLTAFKPMSNSKFLLANLAGTDIVVSVVQITYNFIYAFSGKDVFLIFERVLGTIWLSYYFSVFFLTIDRLIAVRFPWKYRAVVTKKRLKFSILVAWLLLVILGTSLFLSNEWFEYFLKYTWLVLDVTFLTTCAITYGIIFTKILQRRRFGNNNDEETSNERRQRLVINREKKFVKIVALIMISFLMLILIPDLIMHQWDSEKLQAFSNIAWPMALIMDPVVYIFLQDDLRSLLKRRVFNIDNGLGPTQQ